MYVCRFTFTHVYILMWIIIICYYNVVFASVCMCVYKSLGKMSQMAIYNVYMYKTCTYVLTVKNVCRFTFTCTLQHGF